MKKPPMGDWVKRGVSVVCSTGFTMDFPTGVPGSLTICNSSPHPHAPDDDIFTKSVIIVCNGTPGRVLSVGSRNVKVYLTSNDDKTPKLDGRGRPCRALLVQHPRAWRFHLSLGQSAAQTNVFGLRLLRTQRTTLEGRQPSVPPRVRG